VELEQNGVSRNTDLSINFHFIEDEMKCYKLVRNYGAPLVLFEREDRKNYTR